MLAQPCLSSEIEHKTLELKALKVREKQQFTDFYNAHKNDKDVIEEIYTKLESLHLVETTARTKKKVVPAQLVKCVLRRRYAGIAD